MAKETKQKKKKGRSIQQLIGIKTFTKSGIKVGKDELFFFAVAPTNISVLSAANEKEPNPNIRKLIKQDMDFLDSVQTDISTARQFMLIVRIKGGKTDKQFSSGDIERKLREQGFDFRHLKKPDIKRMLAIYFDASMYGEQMPDVDGAQFLEVAVFGGKEER